MFWVMRDTFADRIVKETQTLLNDNSEYSRMSEVKYPYGDGKASDRVLKTIENLLEEQKNNE